MAGLELKECPVSFIPDGVPELIRDIDRARTVHEAYGPPIFTLPFLEWPAKFTELLELLEHERIAEHNASIKAQMRESDPKNK